MFNSINSTVQTIWKKMKRKAYRDAYVAAHISNTVAAQISMMRDAKGWTQKQLAEKAGMKQSRVSLLEDPNYENFEAGTLRRIASAFDVGLSIRFVPHSAIVCWAANVSDDKLLVPEFEDDSINSRGIAVGSISLTGTNLVETLSNDAVISGPRGIPATMSRSLVFRNDNGITIAAVQ